MRGSFERRLNRSRTVVLIDGGGENARVDIEWHGVEVVGRGKPPASGLIQEAVIAQMVVAVRDENIEYQRRDSIVWPGCVKESEVVIEQPKR